MSILKRKEMPCAAFVEYATAYLEGTISRRDSKRLEAHLGECEPCSLYLEQLRQTLRIAKSIEREPVPTHVKEDLARVFTQWRRPL